MHPYPVESDQELIIGALAVGAEDMLATDVPFIPDAQLTTIDVPNPNWLPELA